jgi:hypothetical protein
MVGHLRFDDIRDHFAQLGARARIVVTWNGAGLDRLLDARHAHLVDNGIRVIGGFGWTNLTEVTFSEYGERGSIDIFSANSDASAVLVGEIKTDWGAMEETLRRLDVKARLAPKLAVDAFGFRPMLVGRVLILPEESTARRIAAKHSETLGVALPDRGRAIRSWLRTPAGPLRGLWFLSDVRAAGRPPEPSGGLPVNDP